MKHFLVSLAFVLVAVVTVSYSLAQDAATAIDAPAAAAVNAPPLPDPAASPGDAVSMLSSLWKSGAVLATLVVALYFAALLAGRWVPWLRGNKRRAAITGSAITALAAIAEPASRGTTPTVAMVMAAAATAVALFVKLDGDAAET